MGLYGVMLIAVAFAAFSLHHTEGKLRLVCYYTNWAQYRPGVGRFFPENVDPSLCTHLIYAFARLTGNRLSAFEWNDMSTPWSKGMYERFQELKKQNPALKTLLAVGGWNMGSGPFSQMVSTQQSRAEFVQTSIAFLRQHAFDGMDLDWEYPANRGSETADRDRYTLLVKELRESFEQEASSTGGERLLLTAAVAAGKTNMDTAYDIPQINRYLDFMNLMSYDLHGSWESSTGHHTALYPRADETGDDRNLNVDFAASYWIQKGASPDKLVIGLATYGRSFTLRSASQTGLGAPTRSGGNAGQFTREAGFLAYYEVCGMLKAGGVVHEDSEQHVRYVTLGDQWVGMDDEKSLREKTCYVRQQGYGGVMVWALDEDDFTGTECGQGPYPLLRAVNAELASDSFANCPHPSAGIVTTTKPLQVQTTQKSHPDTSAAYTPFPGVHGNSTSTSQDFSCINLPSDFYPSYHSCDEYFICANQVSYRVKCGTGLLYNPDSKRCDWPENVRCVNLNALSSTTIISASSTPSPNTEPDQAFSSLSAFCAQRNDGLYRYPDDCHKYIECVLHMGFLNSCPLENGFNQALGSCKPLSGTPECQSSGVGAQTTPAQSTTSSTSAPSTITTAPSTRAQIRTTSTHGLITQMRSHQVATTTGQPVSPSEFCRSRPDGRYRVPSDCNQYIECLLHLGLLNHCPQGKVFNEALDSCQSPYNTPECADFHSYSR